MHQLETYIKNSLSSIFFSIFMPLFAIASVVFLIKLATYTAVIQLNVWEMIKLFLFVIPELLFYTLPITFFVAATLALFKFSNDNEIIILFALGIHPKKILKILFKPALIISVVLSVNFFFIFPHAKTLSKNFIKYKKSEAKFNLSASEFGHKFGQWLLYIGKENSDGTYGNVVLFNKKEQGEEVLIDAKKAEIINDKGILRLKLINGEGYNYSSEKFTQLNFKTMFINDTMSVDLRKYQNAFEYWSQEKKKFISNTLLALFPLFSLFLILSIGIVHVRHQKAKIYLYMFLGIAVYYGLSFSLGGALGYWAFAAILIPWFVATYYIYRRHVVAKF
jgi:lipopolysaccharide export system permease protein